jgi:hypothetical protein
VASAFHANEATETSVKSRKLIQAFAMEDNAADKVSDSGGGFSDKTCKSEHNFWRCRVLRNITDDAGSEGVDVGGRAKASRVERNVAPRMDFWSGASLVVARLRDLRPRFKRIGVARISMISFERGSKIPSKELCCISDGDILLAMCVKPESVALALGASMALI